MKTKEEMLEIKRYLEEPRLSRCEDVLIFWNDRIYIYPIPNKGFYTLATVPATSTASERASERAYSLAHSLIKL